MVVGGGQETLHAAKMAQNRKNPFASKIFSNSFTIDLICQKGNTFLTLDTCEGREGKGSRGSGTVDQTPPH